VTLEVAGHRSPRCRHYGVGGEKKREIVLIASEANTKGNEGTATKGAILPGARYCLGTTNVTTTAAYHDCVKGNKYYSYRTYLSPPY
jgi:hypothetical protein